MLTVVFIPTAFLDGLTGQFYRQFALTIAISTVLSAINSLTLSPALAAVLLKPHSGEKKHRFYQSFFGAFNRFFYETLQIYLGSVYVNDFLGRTYQVNMQADNEQLLRVPRRAPRRSTRGDHADRQHRRPSHGDRRCVSRSRQRSGRRVMFAEDGSGLRPPAPEKAIVAGE